MGINKFDYSNCCYPFSLIFVELPWYMVILSDLFEDSVKANKVPIFKWIVQSDKQHLQFSFTFLIIWAC